MDTMILVGLFALSVLFLAVSIGVLVGYFRFLEQKRRLPEACRYPDLESRNAALEKTNETLLKESRSAREVINQADALSASLGALKKENASFQTLNAKLMAETNGLTAAQKKLEVERDSLERKVEALTKDCERLGKEKSDLETAVAKSGIEAQATAKWLEAVKKEHTTAKSELEATKKTIQKLEGDSAALAAENQRRKQANAALAKEGESKSQSVASLEKLRGGLIQQKKELEEKISGLNAEVEKSSAALDGIETRRKSLADTVGKLEEKTSALRKERGELEARNAALTKENEVQVVQNEEAVRKLRELQDTVGAESDKLANITSEYETKKAELDAYQTRKDALLKEIDFLKESAESMRQASGVKAVSDEESLKDLWEPIAFPNLLPPRKEKSEGDLLAETKDYIRGRGLYFPDRVINAFHTSVKCNDISPITVLAGISGTGKSELPKCYAEGMGMNFVLLPVQPRWDSPQDLLGFYNYMEKRYKATELARALVRFDRYNRPSWGAIPSGCTDLSDCMLLVLLDEMNLARVEYYFSEFLSKLETRRGVNPENACDRAKAEIELELTGRAPLRIFPDGNILFTGTMNEDESTQTLSDKVLDRANVLRFGKPDSANLSAHIAGHVEREPRAEGLLYSEWQAWRVPSREVAQDAKVSEWIDRLNAAMDQLQKPFGHRVSQAMAAYVANYPKGTAGGREREVAFADQIEQRILPKLRGVDLEVHEDSIRRIGALIRELEDEKLYEAYQKGCQDSVNGIFMWQGVNRSEEL